MIKVTIDNEHDEDLKNKAKEVLGVDSTEDIEVDVEELMKQIGKELE